MSGFLDAPVIESAGGYQIEHSVRLRASASAYLSRVFSSQPATWTFSAWVKRGKLGAGQTIAASRWVSGVANGIYFNANDTININLNNTTAHTSTAVFRDPSAWYHIVVRVTQSALSYLYVNGVQIGSWTSGATSWIFTNAANYVNAIGVNGDQAANYLDGYLSDVYFIDGQALDASYFGQFNSDGVWTPKAYSGTYGTNGFYLKFNDGSNLTNLCLDRSGNGNNWTATNVSLTAGATYDWMVDTPTNNYAVWNPLSAIGTPMAHTAANLETGTTGYTALSSFVLPTGKWYAEFGFSSSTYPRVGVVDATETDTNMQGTKAISYGTSDGAGKGELWINGVQNNSLTTAGTTSDIYGVAYDSSTRKVWFSKNGVWQNFSGSGADPATATNPVGTLAGSGDVYIGARTATASVKANFGQRPFAYTPPTGFKALCTANMPAVTIPNGRKHFDALTYSGNGTSLSVTGSQFQPDLVWAKRRDSAGNNGLFDAVRGAMNWITSNNTNAETSVSGVTSFNSNGFTVGSHVDYNTNAATNVSWLWKAGGAPVTNNAGSITAQVSANTAAGISIVTYTGTGANATVGHGLGVVPKMLIVKRRDSGVDNWWVYHSALTSAAYRLRLNTTDAQDSQPTGWNSTAPSSSVFSIGSATGTNGNAQTHVAYCFAEVPGFSKFGSYTGNGSTDGPFVFCGFRPRWVMIKHYSGSISAQSNAYWMIVDTARSVNNSVDLRLHANMSDTEYTNAGILDITANGFKLRWANADVVNYSGGNYIFAAFAENPFGGSNVAPATAR